MTTEVDPRLIRVASDIARLGGRALVVGGWVRDRLLGLSSKDVDVEVFGLSPERLEAALAAHGTVLTVGRSFGVYKVKGLEADFSLPRRDSKVAPGHRGFEVTLDPALDFEGASRRRDFTVNSIALDPLNGEIIDPHGGREDLAGHRLRATDPEHFAEDPLRGLRAAQFIARFGLDPDPRLIALCRELGLGELPGERIFEEFRKLLLLGTRPSCGLDFLRASDQVRFFPELAALIGLPQDPFQHPEGDVWTHTVMVADVAATLRGEGDGEALMFAALCHDLGKPATAQEVGGHVLSPGHDRAGVEPTRTLLARMRAPERLVACVSALVADHLAPARLVAEGAPSPAYRHLARRLESAGADVTLLERLARADHLGRATPDARAGRAAWSPVFLARAEAALVGLRAPPAAVAGRHLIARGLTPGPDFARILDACRDIQDETGWDDPDRILDRVLSGEDPAPDPQGRHPPPDPR